MRDMELHGQSGWKGKVSGLVHILHWDSPTLHADIEAMPQGAVLVTTQTRAHLKPALAKASAIVTDEGGMLSHAAILSREHKLPSVLGTQNATSIFKTGDMVEVDADNGIVRKI